MTAIAVTFTASKSARTVSGVAIAENGYRPVDPEVLKENADKFPVPKGLFTIEDLGGWETVSTEFFDPENGSVAEIERELGVPTG